MQSGSLGGGGSSDMAAKADANTAALQRETQATAELSSTQSGAVASIQAFNEARRQAAIAGTEAALADQKEAESLAALTAGETAATASVDAQRMSMAEYQTMIGGTTVNQAALTASTAGLTTANTGATASTAELTASERLLAEGEANIAEGNALIVASYLALNPLEEANVVATDAAAGANIRLQQSLGPISSSMAGLGTAAGITALAIGVVVGVSEVFAAKWESEMQRIQANTTLTDAGMKQMQQTVMQIGARSSAPLSELAQGYMRLSNEGFNAAQATKILDAAQQLAVGTGAKVSEVVNIVGVAMHDYKIPADEATQTTNLLLNAVKNGNTTMSEFASPLQRLTPIASQVGISFLDLTAAIATLTKEGVPAAMVYSQLMNTMVRMTEPTTAQEKELRKLSEATGKDLVTAWSAATIAGGGFENSIRLTHEALVQSGTEIQKLEPNMRGLTGGIALMGKGYEDWNNMIVSNDAAMRGDTVAQEAYQRSLETTAGKLGLLKNAAMEAAISLGSLINPQVKTTLDDFTGWITHAENSVREFSIVNDLLTSNSITAADRLRVYGDVVSKNADDLDKLVAKYGITNPLIEKNALNHALAAGAVKGNDDALDEHLNRLDRENSGLNGLQLNQRNTALSTVGLTDSLTDLSVAAAKAGTSADGFSTNIKKVFDTLVAGIPAIITAGLDLEELNKVLAGGTSNNFLFAKSIGGMGEALKGVGALAASVSKSHTDATLAVRDEAKAYADDTRAQQALMEGKPALAAALTAEGVAFRGTDVAAQQLAERNVALATTQETLNTKIGREGVTAQKALTTELNSAAADQRTASELIVKGKLEEAAGYTEASQLESAGDKQGALDAIAAGKERQTAADESAKAATAAVKAEAADQRAANADLFTYVKTETLNLPVSWRAGLAGVQAAVQSANAAVLADDQALAAGLQGDALKTMQDKRQADAEALSSAKSAYTDQAAAAASMSAAIGEQEKAQNEQAAALRASDLTDTIAKNQQKLASELNTIQQAEQALRASTATQSQVAQITADMYLHEAALAKDSATRQKDEIQAGLTLQVAAIKKSEADQINAIQDIEQQKLVVLNKALLTAQENVQKAKANDLLIQADADQAKANIDIALAGTQVELANQVMTAQLTATKTSTEAVVTGAGVEITATQDSATAQVAATQLVGNASIGANHIQVAGVKEVGAATAATANTISTTLPVAFGAAASASGTFASTTVAGYEAIIQANQAYIQQLLGPYAQANLTAENLAQQQVVSIEGSITQLTSSSTDNINKVTQDANNKLAILQAQAQSVLATIQAVGAAASSAGSSGGGGGGSYGGGYGGALGVGGIGGGGGLGGGYLSGLGLGGISGGYGANMQHFAAGGTITEPVIGVGLSSGGGYSFGESGPEVVSPVGGTTTSGGGGTASLVQAIGVVAQAVNNSRGATVAAVASSGGQVAQTVASSGGQVEQMVASTGNATISGLGSIQKNTLDFIAEARAINAAQASLPPIMREQVAVVTETDVQNAKMLAGGIATGANVTAAAIAAANAAANAAAAAASAAMLGAISASATQAHSDATTTQSVIGNLLTSGNYVPGESYQSLRDRFAAGSYGPGGTGPRSPVTAYASGGISSGGWSLVGEQGPELLNLTPGSQVIPNNQIPHFANGTTGGLPSMDAVQTLAQQQLQTTLQQQTLTEVTSQRAITQGQTQILQQQTTAITSGTAAVTASLASLAQTVTQTAAASNAKSPSAPLAGGATSSQVAAAGGAGWNQVTADAIKNAQAINAAQASLPPIMRQQVAVLSQENVSRALAGQPLNGFASGGILPEDILGVGSSGQSYQLHGGERVTPVGGATVGAAAQAAMQTAQGASSGTVTVNVTVGGKTITQQVLANLSTNQALEVSIP